MVMIALLAVFAIVMALAAVWARAILADHRQQRSHEELVQVRWLAEAAVRRAAASLAANPAYRGETWQVDAAQLTGSHAASVVIRVEPVNASNASAANPNDKPTLRIEAQVSYPRDVARLRETKTVVINPSRESPS
jgi:type II secretory pathway pseudopilin PulG